jgi:hypothetical protein
MTSPCLNLENPLFDNCLRDVTVECELHSGQFLDDAQEAI